MKEFQTKRYSIQVPRNSFRRALIRFIGKLVLPLVAKIKIVGLENIPHDGPVIMIGNHVAVMEPVLMAVYSPKQIEFIGSVDVPHEPSTKAAMDAYQMIPVFRGKPERKSLKQSLEVLEQKGFLAIFPEGGLWAPGQMQAKTGVSFLSHRTGAPVLPIAFIGAEGALNAIFQLKRPEIMMIVGELIPALKQDPEVDLRETYEQYADFVMKRVFALLPEEVLARMHDIARETFHLEVLVSDGCGFQISIPKEYEILHSEPLAMLLHRPAILKIFNVNLKLPVEPLQHLCSNPSMSELQTALDSVISYLNDEDNGNPYLLTYRFGIETGKEMLCGLLEFNNLVNWCITENYQLRIKPVRNFFSNSRGMELTQIEQGEFSHWR